MKAMMNDRAQETHKSEIEEKINIANKSKYRIPLVPPDYGHGHPWGGVTNDRITHFPREFSKIREKSRIFRDIERDDFLLEKYYWYEYLTTTKQKIENSDAVIVGIPMDVGVGYRHGARFGPRAIREASCQFSSFTECGFDLSETIITDIGDIEIHPYVVDEEDWRSERIQNIIYHQYLKNREVPPMSIGGMQRIEKTIKWVMGGEIKNLTSIIPNEVPRKKDGKRAIPICLGGGHEISYPCIAGVYSSLENEERENFYVIYFDAHPDLLERRSGLKRTHASQATRVAEYIFEHHPRGYSEDSKGRVIQVGVRYIEGEEAAMRRVYGIKWLKMGPPSTSSRQEEMEEHNEDVVRYSGVEESIEQLREWLHLDDGRECHLYISVDIDVLDVGLVPGTGVPDLGGLTGRELVDILQGTVSPSNVRLHGMDCVETAPDWDVGNISGITSVKIIFETLGTYFKHHKKRIKGKFTE